MSFTMADQIRALAEAKGFAAPLDPDTVDLELRRSMAKVVGGKLFDVNMALKSSRGMTPETREAVHQYLIAGAMERLEADRKAAEQEAAADAKRAEQEAKAAAKAKEAKRKRAEAEKFPSQKLPQLSRSRLHEPFGWVRPAAEQWAGKRDHKVTYTIRMALQAEIVDRKLDEIEFADGPESASYLPAGRLPESHQHLLSAITKTRDRLQRQYKDRKVGSSDVVRTALARFLRREGFGPKP